LNAGANKLKVYTDRSCQGIFEKIINLNKITVYPNPFIDRITIDMGGSNLPKANVEIRTVFDRILYNQEVINDGGLLSIDTSGFGSGVYLLKLTSGETTSVFKIIKK
jgi:hypothetical protein